MLMAFSTKNLVYSAGADLVGMEANNVPRYPLRLCGGESGCGLGHVRQRTADSLLHLGGGQSRLRFRDGRDCGLDYLLDLILGQAGFRLGHLRQGRADCLFHLRGGEPRLRRGRIRQLRLHYLPPPRRGSAPRLRLRRRQGGGRPAVPAPPTTMGPWQCSC